jgi:hypothetical protein
MRSLIVPLALAATLASLEGCSGGNKPSSSGTGTAGSGADAGSGANAGNLPDGSAASDAAKDIEAVGSDGSGVDSSGPDGSGVDGGDGNVGGADGSAVDIGSADAGTSRLVPWQIEAEGTAPLVMGIYDSQAKVHCRFLPDEAGQLRCLPWALAPFTETASFSDAACTKRIYLTDTAVGPTWVGRPTALPLPRTACSPRRYTVGTLRALPAPAPHFGGTPCAEIQPVPDPGFGHVEMTVVEIQATDTWEKGTQVDGSLIGGRMRVKLVEAPDGTRFVDDFLEAHWNKPCHLVASGNDVYCQANAVLSSTGNEGTQCTGPRVWRAHACDDPAFLFSNPSAFALGPVWSGPASNNGGHGCSQVAASSTIDGPDVFFETGAPLSDAIMGSQPWQAAGTGRLRLRGLADAGGNVVTFPTSLLWRELDSAVLTGAHARYFDTVANTNCNPIRTPEGQLRCVPTSVAFLPGTPGFADDKCTEPVFYCPNFTASCPGIFAVKAALEANGEMRAETLNATRVVTTYFSSASGACAPSPFTSPGVFALGVAATWTQYPAFTDRNGRAPDGP